jgi:hypothetical protein
LTPQLSAAATIKLGRGYVGPVGKASAELADMVTTVAVKATAKRRMKSRIPQPKGRKKESTRLLHMRAFGAKADMSGLAILITGSAIT